MGTNLKEQIRRAREIGFGTSLLAVINKKNKNLIFARKFIKKYGYNINNLYKEYLKNECKDSFPVNNIFIFWYQTSNLAELPSCARMCIERIYKLFGQDFRIHFISKENLSNYIVVDPSIKRLLETGKINIQNFTDYVRFKLVNIYGGYWIDSTVLFKNYMDLKFYNSKYSFYSLNCEESREFLHDDVDSIKHCAWLFSAWKNSPITYIFYKFFEQYYKKHDTQFGYFMVDYVMFAIYKIPELNNIFSKIPETNIHPYNFYNSIIAGKDPSKLQLENIEKLSNYYINDKIVNIIQSKIN